MQLFLSLALSLISAFCFLAFFSGCSSKARSREESTLQIEALAALHRLLKERPILHDRLLTDRVNRVQRRLELASTHHRQWPRVIILQDRDVYALTVPEASTILISSALLHSLRSEDELSFVLAHEAAHVFLGHMMKSHETPAAAQRRLEIEADEYALTLSRRAGYDSHRAIVALISIPRPWEITRNTPSEEPPLERYLRLEKQLSVR